MDLNLLSKLSNTIRFLSADAVEKAKSGHPGMPMGTAELAAVLWSYHLNFNPKDTAWAGRDRFVLSAGHGSMLLYSLLHLFGYDLPMSEIQNFRQWGSRTPGHPEFGMTPGVETTTGPLGQGFANGVGMAISGKMFEAKYSQDLFSYRVYGIVSDGDLMEGVALEAASLAGHLGLNNLIYIYDDNDISIGGSTDVCFTENVGQKFQACNWFVQWVDGNNLKEVNAAIEAAKNETKRPSLIVAKTIIGKGSPHKENTAEVHGSPLGAEELKLAKKTMAWPESPDFLVPEEVGQFCCTLMESKISYYNSWQTEYSRWSDANRDLAIKFNSQIKRELPESLKSKLINFGTANLKKVATRNLSGDALQIISKEVSSFIGGSADLEPSTLTLIKDSHDISAKDFSGKNLRFGIREHAMGSIANGLAYTKAWIPYTSTFLVFADYMRPPIRLAALSHLQTLFIFTHDSFWVGEDGPTHEPIEQLMSLRLIPNLYVFRPADSLEVGLSYYAACTLHNRPSALLFTRQALEPIKRDAGVFAEDALRGGYIVQGADVKDLIIVATGSEVSLAQGAADILAQSGTKVRVVSMPCWELFFDQDKEYQKKVIPQSARRISIEAGSTLGWERLVGEDGLMIGLDHYGASAPGNVIAEKFGFTSKAIAERIKNWL
ncbi:MAG: transketolase [bacterium]|nr:transketolase [bacterium]